MTDIAPRDDGDRAASRNTEPEPMREGVDAASSLRAALQPPADQPAPSPAALVSSSPPRARRAEGDSVAAARDRRSRAQLADSLRHVVDALDVLVREIPRGADASVTAAKHKVQWAREALAAAWQPSRPVDPADDLEHEQDIPVVPTGTLLGIAQNGSAPGWTLPRNMGPAR